MLDAQRRNYSMRPRLQPMRRLRSSGSTLGSSLRVCLGLGTMGNSSKSTEFGSMEDLQALGYEYRGGRLLKVDSDEGFTFKDQAHYDKLADAVLAYVTALLESEGCLTKLSLPLDSDGGPQCPVYVSDNLNEADHVLLLIQGSGRVRVGVWGCALCINKDLQQGTMLPFIHKAREQEYGVIVLNPNYNEDHGKRVPGSETPDRHVAHVWKHLVRGRCKDDAPVDIIAHSNGGRATLQFLGSHGEAAGRIRRIVFTDSYHSEDQVAMLQPAALSLLRRRSVNYVPHDSPLGTPVSQYVTLGHHMTQASKGCTCLSAATLDHASTNHASLTAAFDFLASE